MSDEGWFRARLRFAVLIQQTGLQGYSDSVFVFRSADFDSAFLRALQMGREHEEEYTNGDGDRVRRRLAGVMSLDGLRGALDGAEVYSEPVHANDPISHLTTNSGRGSRCQLKQCEAPGDTLVLKSLR